jgi:hypothetical protein
MKTLNASAKKCGCWSLLFGLSALAASASIQVTYNVDMSVQRQLGNFHPANGDTVFVSGNFATTNGAWLQTAADGSTNYILTAGAGVLSNIYSGTFTVTNEVGTFENHQFVMNPGGNFSALTWEPNIVGGGNRFYPVPSVNTNLPAVFFNDVSNATQLVVSPVTFSVNMSVQTSMGNFDRVNDLVLVAGDFNGFTATSGTLLTDNGNNVWTNTCLVTNTVGAAENYKFLFLPFSGTPASVWEVDGLGPTNAPMNRQFILPAQATNIPVAYFSNVTNPPSYANVTFNVNMAVQHARGTFTPGVDSVSVAGNPLNNWTTGIFVLTQSPTNADLYVGTFSVTNVGSTTSFKYVDSNTGIGNGGWETTPNRTTMVPQSGTNLPVVFWNNTANLGNLSVSNNAGVAVLKWTAGPNVRLQSSTSLSSGWGTVANTQGSNSATININGKQFFRLNGP